MMADTIAPPVAAKVSVRKLGFPESPWAVHQPAMG